jgi:hypothetical protein
VMPLSRKLWNSSPFTTIYEIGQQHCIYQSLPTLYLQDLKPPLWRRQPKQRWTWKQCFWCIKLKMKNASTCLHIWHSCNNYCLNFLKTTSLTSFFHSLINKASTIGETHMRSCILLPLCLYVGVVIGPLGPLIESLL